MSTRCQVKVIAWGKEVMLYHHCDGYPEGVGYCLMRILRINRCFYNVSDLINRMVKKGKFEITFGNHSDIEYFYELNFDKNEVNCMAVNNWGDKMEILERIPLKYDEEKDVQVDKEIFKGIKDEHNRLVG